MPAVGRNLPLQLRGQQLLATARAGARGRRCTVGADERDQAQQARVAVGRVAPGGGEIGDLVGEAAHDGAVAPVRRAPSSSSPACDSQEMTRRATTSGSQAGSACRRLRRIHSPTSCWASARASCVCAASRWRSQPKPCSSRAHCGLGGATANGERPPSVATAAGEPEAARATSSAKLASATRRSGGASSSSSAAGTGSASAAAASGACGRAPRGPPAPRLSRARPTCSRAVAARSRGRSRGAARAGRRGRFSMRNRLAWCCTSAKPPNRACMPDCVDKQLSATVRTAGAAAPHRSRPCPQAPAAPGPRGTAACAGRRRR